MLGHWKEMRGVLLLLLRNLHFLLIKRLITDTIKEMVNSINVKSLVLMNKCSLPQIPLNPIFSLKGTTNYIYLSVFSKVSTVSFVAVRIFISYKKCEIWVETIMKKVIYKHGNRRNHYFQFLLINLNFSFKLKPNFNWCENYTVNNSTALLLKDLGNSHFCLKLPVRLQCPPTQ